MSSQALQAIVMYCIGFVGGLIFIPTIRVLVSLFV
jgi:hypothetical protein